MSNVSALEQVLIGGNLAALNESERVTYYHRVCESLSLNPLTKPFEYLSLNGKLILYARRDCAEQLRKRDKVSTKILDREVVEGCYVVTASASTPDGRIDESIGAVSIDGLKGEPRANAMMKAETKAKRRVTLSICGLGMLDETEVDSFAPQVHKPPAAKAITGGERVEKVDPNTGEVTDPIEEKPDRALVEEGFRLFDECRNRAECETLAELVKANKAEYTPAGFAVLTDYGRDRWKALPKAVEPKKVAPAKPQAKREPGDESENADDGILEGAIPY